MRLAQQGGVRHLVWIAALPLLGCTGDLHDLSSGDASAAGSPDLALAPAGDDGGEVPQTIHFNPDIEADIENKGCTLAPACHGGTQVPVLKAGAVDDNYLAFKAEAMMGEDSPVLIQNLAGSGATHSGGAPFSSKADPVYVRWLAWINGGNAP